MKSSEASHFAQNFELYTIDLSKKNSQWNLKTLKWASQDSRNPVFQATKGTLTHIASDRKLFRLLKSSFRFILEVIVAEKM